MHHVLSALPRVHVELRRSDALATRFGFRVVATSAEPVHGFCDVMHLPRRKNSDRNALERMVILQPTSSVAYDYDLGFKEDYETCGDKVFVCYRYLYEFENTKKQQTVQLSSTIFWEAVADRWYGSAITESFGARLPLDERRQLKSYGLPTHNLAKRIESAIAKRSVDKMFYLLAHRTR